MITGFGGAKARFGVTAIRERVLTKHIMKDIKDVLQAYPAFKQGEEAFVGQGNSAIYGLGGSQKAFLYSRAMTDYGMRPTIIVVHDREHKEQWERDLAFLLPTVEIMPFPVTESIGFAVSARSLENHAAQMSALGALVMRKPVVVVATAEEAAQRIVLPEYVKDHVISFTVDQTIEREAMLELLVAAGYERTDQVEARGHFSVRGDIVDVFPINSKVPYRLEFFGDTIDTIRSFSTDTQRSLENKESCLLVPVQVDGEEKDATLFSYGGDGILIYDEPGRIQEELKKFMKEDASHAADFCGWTEAIRSVRAATAVAFTFLQQRLNGLSGFTSIGIQGKSMTSFERQLPLLTDEIKQWQRNGHKVVLVMNNRQRREGVERALTEDGIDFETSDGIFAAEAPVLIVNGLLSEGFELPHCRLAVVTEANIFGQQKRRLRKKVPKGRSINYFTDLKVGDYVVHSVHGIGKYIGLKTIETEGIHKDYIEIAYAGTDRLFLPADNLDQLQKYIGNEGDTPRIHKMGGGEWRKIKNKAQKSIDDLAEKLVALYAEREVVKGFAFLPDQPWQREFEDAFPYEETEDQLQATKEIKESMEKPYPMDRLLCGDVGFGKTEVAMRAVFKAVLSGKQVAVLVPTTVLAQQHFQTFTDRFAPFGAKVDVLNRFRSIKEKREIMKRVESGETDIVIGTHALLNKKIHFKSLGLLVVDEEQRFGVAQKEKWKSWATNIDVLTLSATPIPRTLHMSLVGVREMSVINTPPEERLPVQTYVTEFDLKIIVDAVRREIQRGGQVYFVYNRVQSIERIADMLEEAMPEIRLAVAHGQMTGAQMEAVMIDFYEGRYDVLLCTSIIETGLDIPNANTIIVYDADRLGLSQLYQMRGRVGRSRRRAYAYFMYRPDKMLSEAAEKRLKAIEEFTELGAGFKLAMRDLEIRGAGNLLGPQQHGNIASVGFAMYCTMLEAAIAKAQHKEAEAKELPDPTVDLEIDAFIDDAYIGDSARKITLYQRLLHIKTQAALHDFIDELIDRFGTPTPPVDALLRLASIRETARTLGLKSIVWRGHTVTLLWADDSKMANWDMAAVDERVWKRIKFTEGKEGRATTLVYNTASLTGARIPIVEDLLTELERRA